MVQMGLDRLLSEAFDKAGVSEQRQAALLKKVRDDLDEPVKLIGAGQCGVGKSTLLRSIFALEEDDIPEDITTSATSAETQDFNSFQIQSEEGFAIEFTDGPGLGESLEKDRKYVPRWIDEVKKHDLLYWVVDASSRDVAHIQRNLEEILDETGYHERVVVVLNKVDQIELRPEDREAGAEGWNDEYNLPSDELETQIERRTNDLIEKFENIGLSRNQVVACSALKRWNTMEVLDTLIEHLPPKERVKAAANRDVDSFAELMDEEAYQRLEPELSEMMDGGNRGDDDER